MTNTSRRGSGNTTALLSTIICVILTILFGILTFSNATHANGLLSGSQENPQEYPTDRSLTARQTELASKEKEVTEKSATIKYLEAEVYKLDMELAREGFRYDTKEDAWINLVATNDGGGLMTKWTRTRIKIANIQQRIDAWRKSYAAREGGSHFEQFQELEDKLQSEMQNVLAQASEAETAFEEEKEQLLEQLSKLRAKKKANEKTFRDKFGELRTRRTQLDARIRDLLDLRLEWLQEIKPDGKVLEVDLVNNYLIIDMGSANRVFRGLRFEVFQYDRGQHVRKAMVEVIEMYEHFSRVRILESFADKHNPITTGDLIGNPIFDRRGRATFVLAGEFEIFNRSDLITFIEQTGGQVVDTLGPGVDFLVSGNRAEDAEDAAREYQIIAMKEARLIEYLQTTFQKGQ